MQLTDGGMQYLIAGAGFLDIANLLAQPARASGPERVVMQISCKRFRGTRYTLALREPGPSSTLLPAWEGARANLGLKKGRYLYEVKLVESLNPGEGQDGLKRRLRRGWS